MSVSVIATWFFTILSLSLMVYSDSENDFDCSVLVSEAWPVPYVFAPQESTIIINCTSVGGDAFWSIDLANDSVSTQYQFSNRQEILNAHGVYELPPIETPGMPPTLRLMINDTADNNQTEILCTDGNKSIDTILFLIVEPNPPAFEVTAMGEQYINISWVSSLAFMATQSVHYNLSISHGSSRQQISRDLNEAYYLFTAPEGAPPCEVYNFSVAATYVGTTYTGAGCNVPLEILMLYSRNPLDTDRFWMKIDLLGELILNITVEETCTQVTYILEPADDTITFIRSNESVVTFNDSSMTVAHNFSISINTIREMDGVSSYNIKFYKPLNDSEREIIKDMNVIFSCDLDDTYNLQCTLVLNYFYSDVIIRFTGDNNSAVKEINSCHMSSTVYYEDLTADDHLIHEKIITQNFSINSTCTSDNAITTAGQGHWIAVIITIVIILTLSAIIFVSTLLSINIVRRKKINCTQHTTSTPPEHQTENGGQNYYQEVEEAQTSIQPQEVVPVYDHVNLNNTHEIAHCTGDEAGYNTTQHTLQRTPADYERHENGGGDYAKLQNNENHYYHTLERDRDPLGIEVNGYTASSIP